MNSTRIIFADINGVMKGKLIPDATYTEAGVYGTPRSVLLQDISGAENYSIESFSPDSGDSDMRLVPVTSTLCEAPGKRDISQVVCDLVDMQSGEPIAESPREVLKRVESQLEAMNLTAKVAIELEFFITNLDGSKLTKDQLDQPYGDVNALFKIESLINEYLHGTETLGLTPECVLSESGEGQLEINYQPMSPLEMADRTFMFKQMIKEIALASGFKATFLAKPYADTSGSGSHVHISLYDQAGNNVFHTPDTLEAFVSGQVAYAADLYALYAPNPNSYRRVALSQGYVPSKATHGNDDRKVALRIVGSEQNLRVENRIAGSDVNPYVQLAVSLGSGLEGIRSGLHYADERVARAESTDFASSLPEAISLLQSSAFAGQLLGAAFVDAFVAVKNEEWKLFLAHITTWESEAYGPLV